MTRKLSEEHRRKISEARRRRTPEQEDRRLSALREAKKREDPSYRLTPEYKEKQRQATKKKWENGTYEGRAEKTAATRASWSPEKRAEVSRKMSEAKKKAHAEGRYANRRPAPRRRVSNIEYCLAPYLTKLGYRHNDDGHTYLGKRVPDFIDIPGRRVFEFFGNFWHQDPAEEQQLTKYYADMGWQCTVLWEEDLFNWLSEHQELVTAEEHKNAQNAVVVDSRYQRERGVK